MHTSILILCIFNQLLVFGLIIVGMIEIVYGPGRVVALVRLIVGGLLLVYI